MLWELIFKTSVNIKDVFFFLTRSGVDRVAHLRPSSWGTSALADYFPSCGELDQGRSEKWGIFHGVNGKRAHTGEQGSESRVSTRFTVKLDLEYNIKSKKVGKEADDVQVVVFFFFFFFYVCQFVI